MVFFSLFAELSVSLSARLKIKTENESYDPIQKSVIQVLAWLLFFI